MIKIHLCMTYRLVISYYLQEKMSTTKLDILKSIEAKYAKDLRIVAPIGHPSKSRQKYFCTFPYPYMNGRPHLGHAFTIMGCELQIRFRKAKGQNVLFPFAFHGSGMPIVSAAKKLTVEIEKYEYVKLLEEYNSLAFEEFITSLPQISQIKILLDMKVKKEDIIKFMEPTYWVTYFSDITKTDILDLNIHADFTRSFYTTNMNPYYDSFVKWQFDYLLKRGYVYKGKRNVIYSIKDEQACADHDRQSGEGVKPIPVNVKFVNSNIGILMVTIKNDLDIENIKDLVILKTSTTFVKFKMTNYDDIFVCDKLAYENISHQFTNTLKFEFVGNVSIEELQNIQVCDSSGFVSCTIINSKLNQASDGKTGFYLKEKKDDIVEMLNASSSNCKFDFTYEIPESVVVSRSGDICIVAEIDQWLIGYGNEKINLPVKEYVENELLLQNESIRGLFLRAVDWLKEWPCSRNYGLGTYIPETNDLIDSLSDSTIYMAFYTIYHLVTQIPIPMITNKMWDYIFLKTDELFSFGDEFYDDILNKMKNEFNYWYPVDMRVSGKDLVNNHLTMTLLNHQAIWENTKYCPREYFINGYLTLNGEKMSKSTGNFMTVRDAIEKYGSDATRFALTNSFSEGTNDGNFSTELAEAAIMKLHNEVDFAMCFSKTTNESTDASHLWDKVFECEMTEIIKHAENAYIRHAYRQIIICFEALVTAKNKYVKTCKTTKTPQCNHILTRYFEVLVTIMTPVCPVICCNISDTVGVTENWTTTGIHNMKYMWQNDVLMNTASVCNKHFSKKTKQNKLQINVIKRFSDKEMEIINNLGDITTYLASQPKEQYGKYRAFSVYVGKYVEKYGQDWIKWITENNDEEYKMISDNLHRMVNCSFEICLIDPNDRTQFKFGPGSPEVSFIKEKSLSSV